MSKLLAQLQGEAHVVGPDLRQTWERIAQDTLAIEDAVSWHTVPEEGLQLNFEQFAAHDFVESENLKYDPKAFIAAAAVALAD